MKNLKAVINKKSTSDVINKFEYTYNTRDLIETETITNGQIIDNFITGTTSETPNILNQIMSKTAQGQTKTYVYDLDGNMTTGFTPEGYPITMTYDAQNRMTSAQYADGNSVTHRNEYNYAGNSLLAELKKYDAGALSNTTKYLRSGFLPMQERDAANTVSREYTWGLNLGGGIGGLLNLKQGGADYSYLYDGKGNVSALIDSSQNLVASYAYDPFGRLMSKSGTLDQPYTFSTKEAQAGTGQYYYGYRFYDSCSGRWTTRDPIGERGGINLYRAMENNAVNRIDELGTGPVLFWVCLATTIADAVDTGIELNDALKKIEQLRKEKAKREKICEDESLSGEHRERNRVRLDAINAEIIGESKKVNRSGLWGVAKSFGITILCGLALTP